LRRSRRKRKRNQTKYRKRSRKQKRVRFQFKPIYYGGNIASNAFPLTNKIPSAHAKYVGGCNWRKKMSRRTRKR
jgi:hypothetical protein